MTSSAQRDAGQTDSRPQRGAEIDQSAGDGRAISTASASRCSVTTAAPSGVNDWRRAEADPGQQREHAPAATRPPVARPRGEQRATAPAGSAHWPSKRAASSTSGRVICGSIHGIFSPAQV